MNARLRTFALLLAAVTAMLMLVAGPAMATESGGGGEEDSGKISLPETPRDRVGLLILGAVGVAVLAGGVNAVRQLKGERPQATGKIRWR